MKIHNKTSYKYGKLTVLEDKKKIKNRWHWKCQCDCGVIRFIDTCKLNYGIGGQKSCGCGQFQPKENLIGQIFRRLTVTSFSHLDKKLRSQFWHCKCECGKECVLSTAALRRANKPTHSCGCFRKDAVVLSGFDFNRKEIGMANINSLFYTYKKTAKKRNLVFNISKEHFIKLTSQNCHYCGVEPKQIHTKKETNGAYIYNGLDRMDNGLGYEIENIVSCCKTCNYAKRIMSYQEFLEWIKRAYNHLSRF